MPRNFCSSLSDGVLPHSTGSRPLPNMKSAALGAQELAQLNDDIRSDIVVLGVGNEIMGDDAIGITLLRLIESQATPTELERIDFVDGATLGMELLPVVQRAERLLLLDAVAQPSAVPGTAVFLEGNQVPRLLSSKLSPHQVGLLDVLTASRLLGTDPSEVAVVGVVPEHVDLTIGISESVQAGLEDAAKLAWKVLHTWLNS